MRSIQTNSEKGKKIEPPHSVALQRSEGALCHEAARREVFVAEITEWTKGSRTENALSRDELAALDGLGRLLAQRHSLTDNLGHYFANVERADVATGILVLVTFLSDNKRGCCTLSIPRLARFFKRSERAISDAIARLEANKVIFVERCSYKSSSCWPVVHRSFGSQQTPLIWFVDFRAPAKANGRPWKNQPPEADCGGLSETPRSRAQNPPKPAAANTTYMDTTERERARSTSKSLLDENWQLHPECRAWAAKQSASHAHMIDGDVRKFREHYAGHARDDWEKCWRKWWLRTIERPAIKSRYVVGVTTKDCGGSSVHDTSEPFSTYMERMIREGKYIAHDSRARPGMGAGHA